MSDSSDNRREFFNKIDGLLEGYVEMSKENKMLKTQCEELKEELKSFKSDLKTSIKDKDLVKKKVDSLIIRINDYLKKAV